MRGFYAATAPLKINLTLRVLRRREDAYHDLESLVAFADIGDTLRFVAADADGVSCTGEFAKLVEGDNIVLKTLRAARPGLPFFRVEIEKNIPVGAGFGGGSADAGAALRLARDFFGVKAAPQSIGADVAACFHAKSAMMRGVGENLEFLRLPPCHAALLYPRFASPTANAYEKVKPHGTESATPRFDNFKMLADYVRATGNDFLNSADERLTDIAKNLTSLFPTHASGMSGSGSGFFVLCETAIEARQAAQKIRGNWPNFWVRDVRLAS